ncbi:hypothetical protein TNCV_4670861 [Trichonephila clavipes]|nr:hypothetical protein TNCV_4670861 [Trichonephila clavipes]
MDQQKGTHEHQKDCITKDTHREIHRTTGCLLICSQFVTVLFEDGMSVTACLTTQRSSYGSSDGSYAGTRAHSKGIQHILFHARSLNPSRLILTMSNTS